jgi:steroid delta-isomerase
MIDEFMRKRLALEHCRLLNESDLEGLLALYEPANVGFEDPVGSGRRQGRDALRWHLAQTLASHPRLEPGDPVSGQDGAHAIIPVTSIMDYLPRGPALAERGWLTPPADPAEKRLRYASMMMIRTGPHGLIQELAVFWGQSDLEILNWTGEAAMTDEAIRKHVALEYSRRMNAGNVDAVMELFGDDIVFEDPVGVAPVIGLEAVRRHISWSIALQVQEFPGDPVAAMDGRHVAVPLRVTVRSPGPLTFRIIGVIEVGEDELIHKAQAFWGLTDTSVGEVPRQPGAADFAAVTEYLGRLSTQRFGAPDAASARTAAT